MFRKKSVEYNRKFNTIFNYVVILNGKSFTYNIVIYRFILLKDNNNNKKVNLSSSPHN